MRECGGIDDRDAGGELLDLVRRLRRLREQHAAGDAGDRLVVAALVAPPRAVGTVEHVSGTQNQFEW